MFQNQEFNVWMGGVYIGKNVRICSSAKIIGCGSLHIGDNTWIGPEVLISSSSNVFIGSDCDIAPRVTLVTGTHEIDTEGAHIAGKGYNSPISIGKGSWICARSLILGGTEIGEKTIVAAGAVVKGVHKGKTIIGGIPAKEIKKLQDSS